MIKRLCHIIIASLLILSLYACGEKRPEKEIELDLDTIATSLLASGHFPDSLEMVDSGFVPGLLSLYEDRIEATPEDLADARYAMTIGVVADQFILLEGVDAEAVDRLEKALNTYTEDQKSSFEFYKPDQVNRLNDPIIKRQGKYLLFAIGEDQKSLTDLCVRLMAGETVEFEPSTQSRDTVPPSSDDDTSVTDQPLAEPKAIQDQALAQTGPIAQQLDEKTDKNTAIKKPNADDLADLDAARKAALDYYTGTIFEIHSLEEVDPWGSWEGDILFRAVCSKGGAPQPDRTIALACQDGVWTVINEGY